MSEAIYVVVMKSQNLSAKMITFFNRRPFNHVSIAMDEKLEDMYSFCRITSKFYPANLTKEDMSINKAKFGPDYDTPCEVYRILISEQQKEITRSIIEDIFKNKDRYSYNYLGLVAIFFGVNLKRKYRHVCSSFVATVLDGIDIKLSKPIFLMTPSDFRVIDGAKKIYSGDINEYYRMRHSS